VTKVTFVPDCEVGESDSSDTQPCSASKRKLDISSSDSGDEYKQNTDVISEGYRLIDMESLRELAARIHGLSSDCQGTVLYSY